MGRTRVSRRGQEIMEFDIANFEPAPSGDYNLDRWLGRREAFSLIAGQCSAAHVQCLKEIRDRKLYESHAPTWGEFCAGNLRMSKRNVNRIISNLQEFGPAYFELSQLTPVSAATYRAIAPQLREGGLACDGELIPLVPENAAKVSATVARLRHEAGPPRATFAAISRRAEELIAAIEGAQDLDVSQLHSLAELILRLQTAAADAGVRVVVP